VVDIVFCAVVCGDVVCVGGDAMGVEGYDDGGDPCAAPRLCAPLTQDMLDSGSDMGAIPNDTHPIL